MVQGRKRSRLAGKAGEPFGIGPQRRRENFQRDVAPQLHVAGAIHVAHPSRPNQVEDLVGSHPCDRSTSDPAPPLSTPWRPREQGDSTGYWTRRPARGGPRPACAYRDPSRTIHRGIASERRPADRVRRDRRARSRPGDPWLDSEKRARQLDTTREESTRAGPLLPSLGHLISSKAATSRTN